MFCKDYDLIFDEEETHLAELENGVVYERSFQMPFERLDAVAPELVAGEGPFDGVINVELTDSNNNLVLSEQMTAEYVRYIYEACKSDDLIDVETDGTYTLRVCAECDAGSGIFVRVGPDNQMNLSLRGGFTGQSDKTGFSVFYLLFSVLMLGCVTSLLTNEKTCTFDKITSLDRLVFGTLVFYCTVFISEGTDIQVIVRGAYYVIDCLKEGKLGSFYDYAYYREIVDGNFGIWTYNYNILLYIAMAIIVFPLKNTLPSFSFIYFIYVQAIIAVLLIYSVFLVKKVVRAFDMDESFVRAVPFLYMTSGLAVFCTVGFGQLDIIYIILLLWGLYYYAQKKYYRFSLIMAFAIAFKTFPLLLFIPLILLTHKRIRDIIAHMAVGLSVTAVHSAIFGNSEGYKVMQKLLDEEQYFMDKISFSRIDNGGLYNGMFGIALFILVFVLVCAFAYMKDIDKDDKKTVYAYVGLVGFMIYVDLFCFLIWHIAWLVPMSLFLAMLIPLFKKTEKLMVFDLVLETSVLLVAERWNGPNIDMLNYGLLTMLPYDYASFYRGATFGMIHSRLPRTVSDTYFALMVGVLLFLAAYFVKYMPATLEARDQKSPCEPVSRVLAWSRTGMVIAYSVFCLWCFYYVG
ncbi:MAG: glycosyltransferase 87 family protein [Saccharofermentans sp.]|nr:glycosyltransferase 87 family protein [Saccharofermentans sp.]